MKRSILVLAIALAAAGAGLAQSDSSAPVQDTTGKANAAAARTCQGTDHRWEAGFRTSSISALPGYATIGWRPAANQLIEAELSGNYANDPTGNPTSVRGEIAAALTWRHQLVAGKHCELFCGIRPSVEYGYSYYGLAYPGYWIKRRNWSYLYSADLLIGVRRSMRAWDRRIAVEIGYYPLGTMISVEKASIITYDNNDNVIGQDDDTERYYMTSGNLNGRAFIGIKYLF